MKKIKLNASRTSILFSSLHSSFPSNAKKRVRQPRTVVSRLILGYDAFIENRYICDGRLLGGVTI